MDTKENICNEINCASWNTCQLLQDIPDAIVEFSINFDSPQVVFYPGQMLTGNVTLDLKAPMDIRSVSIKLTGDAYCCWNGKEEEDTSIQTDIESIEKEEANSSNEPYLNSIEMQEKGNVSGIKVNYIGEESITYQTLCLFHVKYTKASYLCIFDGKDMNSSDLEYPIGKKTYAFSFDLSGDLPSSFESPYGYIRYIVEATVGREDGEYRVRCIITINDLIDTNDPKYAVEENMEGHILIGETIEGNSNIGYFCYKSDHIHIAASIDRSCYCAGEAIFINADIQNKSNDDTDAFYIKLIQKVIYHTPNKNNVKTNDIAVLNGGPISKGQCVHWANKPFAVPATTPTILNSKVITVHYLLQIGVKFLHGAEAVITMYITIGTIPYLPAYGKSVEYDIEKPTTGSPKANYIYGSSYPPPQTKLFGYPDMGPPSYSAILDKKENAETKAEVKHIPVYTFAKPYTGSYDCSNLSETTHIPVHHSPDAIVEFSINFDSPQLVFYPGQMITGHVTLDLKWPIEIKKINMILSGKASCQWKEMAEVNEDEEGNKNNETSANKETLIDYKCTENVINITECLFNARYTDSIFTHTHPAGKHVYKFVIDLSKDLPSSFESRYGFIRYFVYAEIEIPGGNNTTRHPIVVNSLIDTNHQKFASGENGEINWRVGVRKRSFFSFKIDRIEMRATIDRSCYCPGEAILINTAVHNKSDLHIKSFFARLIQIATYRTPGKSKVVRTEIAKMKGPSVPKRETVTWIHQAMGIPAIPPTIRNSDVIKLVYILEIMAIAPKNVEPAIKMYITIGTIPYLEAYGREQIEYGTKEDPQEAPKGNFIDEWSSPPPQPIMFGYPDMYPPCYTADTGAITIPIKHGLNMRDVMQYTPIYTFAKHYSGSYDLSNTHVPSYAFQESIFDRPYSGTFDSPNTPNNTPKKNILKSDIRQTTPAVINSAID